jgi:hypothetical protein
VPAAIALGLITLLTQRLVNQVVDASETFGQRFLTESVSTTFQDALNRLFGDLTQDVQLRDSAITPQGQLPQLWLPTPPPHRLNPRLDLRLSEDRATSVPSPRARPRTSPAPTTATPTPTAANGRSRRSNPDRAELGDHRKRPPRRARCSRCGPRRPDRHGWRTRRSRARRGCTPAVRGSVMRQHDTCWSLATTVSISIDRLPPLHSRDLRRTSRTSRSVDERPASGITDESTRPRSRGARRGTAEVHAVATLVTAYSKESGDIGGHGP